MEKEEYRKLFELEDHLWWFTGMREISLTLLKRFLPSSSAVSVLDAGCGTGGMLPYLSELGFAVGIDRSTEGLYFARRRQIAPLVQASVSQIPFADETFDLVTSFDVIYHRAVPDDEQALAEIARVLRPGGRLLIRVPAYDRLRSRHDEAVHTRQRYGRKELEDKLHRAGLRPVYLTYANCLLFPLAAGKRLVEKARPGTDGSDVEPLGAPWNGMLFLALRLEAAILRHGRLPFGLSLIALAQRTD